MSETHSAAVVHIVDDDVAVLDSLSMLLETIGIANKTYENAQVFIECFKEEKLADSLGCIVLDIRMPLMSGIECQHQLQELGNSLPIIFITGHGDVPMAVEAMKHGAMEFIQKPFREQELLDAIQKALTLSEKNATTTSRKEDILQRAKTLTNREKEIMLSIVAGKANKVIAIDLNLSQRTVEIHRANVMDKMQASSLADLVKMAVIAELA